VRANRRREGEEGERVGEGEEGREGGCRCRRVVHHLLHVRRRWDFFI